MDVVKKEISVRDVTAGYVDCLEEGVVGFGGQLNLRPPYQREFIYKTEQQIAVIKTILEGMPLNIMYWAVNEDGTFEMLDGQQRTMSICRFVDGKFSVDFHFFSDLSKEDQDKILDYQLDIYQCSGSSKEKIKWFETINVAGEKLTNQELRNAIFTGPWVLDAKRYFSKSDCPAADLGDGYVKGSTIRQELLETAIEWASGRDVNTYMSEHRRDPDARPLWEHFQSIINWVKRTFVVPRPKLMSSVNWGPLYDEYKDARLSPLDLEKQIDALLSDEDVTNHKGIYNYLLTGEEKFLNIRTFPEPMKRRVHTKQGGICVHCESPVEFKDAQADHIIPWSKGGKTVEDNCQMLCRKCNQTKSAK